MYIPLDNLYEWIEGLLPWPAIVYRFYPPGQKCITNLTMLRPYSDFDCDFDLHVLPEIICHDQEPLFFHLYENHDVHTMKAIVWSKDTSEEKLCSDNLRAACNQVSIYDNVLLIHSEKNSKDLDKYQQQGYIGVHYWAHAVIARDWFRFAEFDVKLNQKLKFNKLFLIYNRDWTGTREYRLKFCQLLLANKLLPDCQTSVMKTNNMQQYQFQNQVMKPDNFEFLNYLDANTTSASASASYNASDMVSTAISVVLETIFDDSRIHLTEKTLKPIACGHPFILAAGPGSLDYIKSYGFKTFAPWINESYDCESNSVLRMEKIISSMKELQCLPADRLQKTLNEIFKIAQFNTNWFFSKQFTNLVKNELEVNLATALQQVQKTQGKRYLNRHYKKIKTLYTARRFAKLQKLKMLRDLSKHH